MAEIVLHMVIGASCLPTTRAVCTLLTIRLFSTSCLPGLGDASDRIYGTRQHRKAVEPTLLGILVGMVCATPMLIALRESARKPPRVGMGVVAACALLPFMALQLVLLAVWLSWPDALLPFGTAASLALLVAVTVAGLSAWRHMGR